MERFTYEKQIASEFYLFRGFLDEHAKLPVLAPARAISICLRRVVGINSIGTKIWCQWVRSIPPGTKIRLSNCPPSFIKCFNQVHGSLTSSVEIHSFLVPFYSVETGERIDSLYVRGTQFTGKKVMDDVVVLDSAMNKMELDVFPDFFDFISKGAA